MLFDISVTGPLGHVLTCLLLPITTAGLYTEKITEWRLRTHLALTVPQVGLLKPRHYLIAQQMNSLEYAHQSIGLLRSQVTQCVDAQAKQQRMMSNLENAYHELYSYTSDLEEHILTVDANTRKRNVIVSGIAESPNETSSSIIAHLHTLFVQYVDTLILEVFDDAYRLGTPKGKKHNRPLVVKFVSEAKRNEVSRIRFNLDDDESTKNVYLNEDLPKVLNERKSLMRLVVKAAKEKQIPAKLSGGKVTVNNVTYDHQNLNCLPKGLKPDELMIMEIDGKLYFSSDKAWLANFFPTQLQLQGVAFNSSEQAFQYVKACRNNAPELASLILKSKNAVEAKRIGKGIEIKPKWDRTKEEVMKRILEAKFGTNPLLARKLVEIGNKTLVEATIDTYWGAQATINSKSVKAGTWKGANRLGILLMEIQDDLRKSLPHNQAAALEANLSGLSVSPRPSSKQATQSTSPIPTANPPIPPARSAKQGRAKRGNDVLSPAKAPPSIYQKVSSPSGSTGTAYSFPKPRDDIGSPTTSSLRLPISDLFACDLDADEDDLDLGQLVNNNLPAGASCITDDTIRIGTQSV